MDAQELRNLQEAYLKVYTEALDEEFKDLTPEKKERVLKRRDELVSKVAHHHDKARENADEFRRRKDGKGLVAKAKQFVVGNRGPQNRTKQHVTQFKKYKQHVDNIGDALSKTQASKDASMHHQRNQIRQKLRDLGADPDAGPDRNNIRRFQREDFDIYDIILDHLLDERYADTIKSAEAIMVNMSEEWRDAIIDEAREDEGLTPLQKIRKRNERDSTLANIPAGRKTTIRRDMTKLHRGYSKRMMGLSARQMNPKPTDPYDYDNIKEQTDIYDIILSHLLGEGYAETPEAAEAIMVNMSEEWRNSIIG